MADLWEDYWGRAYSLPSFSTTGLLDEDEDNSWSRLWQDTRRDPVGTAYRTVMEASQAGEAVPARNWFDRMIAPLEAPQQFLFSLTKGIAEDGFQLSDLTDAATHAAKFFLPWSEQPRIATEEITDIFFGEGTSEIRGWGLAANLGIALLYDPLWLAGPGGLAAKLGASSRTVKNLTRVVNPASAVLEGLSIGGRAAGRGIAAGANAALGAERYAELSGTLKHWFQPPSKALPEEWNQLLTQTKLDVAEARIQMGGVLKTAEHASPGTSEILVEAFVNKELRSALIKGERGSQRAKEVAGDFFTKLEGAGVDKEIAMKLFEDFEQIHFALESRLLETGLLNPTAHRALSKRHLRQSYTELQNPVDIERRLNQIRERAKAGDPRYADLEKGAVRFHDVEMRKAIEKFSDHLVDIRPGRGGEMAREFQDVRMANSAARRRYFPDVASKDGVVTRRFNADNFADDLMDYLETNKYASLDDVMEHVAKNMLDMDSLPAAFGENLARYLATGQVRELTLEEIYRAVVSGKPSAQMTIQSRAVAYKKIQDRGVVPQVILDEVFGFQHSAFPRMVETVNQVATEAALGRMLDQAAGAVRIGTEDYRWVQNQLANAIQRLDASGVKLEGLASSREFANATLDIAERLSGRMGISLQDARNIVRRIDGTPIKGHTPQVLKEGGYYAVGRGGLATTERTAINTRLLSDDAAWGPLAGMYVPETVYRALNHAVTAVEDIGVMTAKGLWGRLGDAMQGLSSFFKFMKIPGDPGAHARDFVGSLVQMDSYGLLKFDPESLSMAARLVDNVKHGKIDEYLQLAHDIGFDLLGGTFSASELSRRGASLVAPDATKLYKLDDWFDRVTESFEFVRDAAGKVQDYASGVYQHREQMLRSYSFISRYESLAEGVRKSGKTITRDVQLNLARQAASTVESALYNYADIPMVTEWARRYGIAPFITFPTKAAGQLVDMIYHRPQTLLRYHRGMQEWNSHWAGGDLAYAQEIQALPDHIRQNLVVRMPYDSKDGTALYIDLSYFLPWSSVRDLTRDVGRLTRPFEGLTASPEFTDESGIARAPESERFGGSYPGAVGGSIFSPVLVELLRPFVTGKDGLGRDIHGPADTPTQKAMNLGRELYQFMAPPTALPGGSTADSVGRAIMAAAQTSDEPRNWVEYLGLAMRLGKSDDVLNRYGEAPTSRALVKSTDNPYGQMALGLLSTLVPVTESDPDRAKRNQMFAQRASNNEASVLIRQIASNPNLSDGEKRVQIGRVADRNKLENEETKNWMRFLGL